MGMATGKGGDRMETEIGQGLGVDKMKMQWKQHENHWWVGWNRDRTEMG